MGGQESQNQNGAAKKALARHPQRNMERHVALACPILAIKKQNPAERRRSIQEPQRRVEEAKKSV
jgi:hypothetical protein